MRLAALPVESKTGRWVPTRAGILNLWRYYDEVFEFHHGRLLLRGPNGTGKSKALELLLPFLFDANLRASRLSTFGTSERTMHWNLMGEGATGTTRVGYVWLEFCLDDAEWFCCGARLQATAHTTAVGVDYFTTGQRIAVPGGLSLINDAGQPLTKPALTDALGEHGTLHRTADEYRTEVRRTLFPDMNEQRYDALITALLQLRTPKLSERLDPGLLSSLLSRALPPLGQAEISELAEGFERLDRQREQLAKLDSEVSAAKTLATRQRSYAQRVLRAAAAGVISATAELARLARNAKTSEEGYDKALADRAEAGERKATLDAEADRLRARIDGLTHSEEYQQGRELDTLRQRAVTAEQVAAARHQDAEAKAVAADQDARQATAAQQALRQVSAMAVQAESDAVRAARHAGMAGAQQTIAESLGSEISDPSRVRQLPRAAVASRKTQINEVRRALARHDTAVHRRRDAEEELERARAGLSEATAARTEAAKTYRAALDSLRERLRAWAAACAELRFDDPEALADRAESEPAVLELVEVAARRVLQAVTEEQTRISTQRDTAMRESRRLSEEIGELTRMVDLPPVAPATRTADRSKTPGAPLWRLVRFADGVPTGVQATVEAGLQASGLLDAWVFPDGRASANGHDTVLTAEVAGRVPDRSLAEVLLPEPDSAVPPEQVWHLLSQIGYGETLPSGYAAAVGADGQWRLGNAVGSWAKPEAEHIGTTARERHRQRRIAELSGQLETLRATIAGYDADLAAMAERRAGLDRERTARPRHTDVDAARAALDRAESTVGNADDAVRHWISQVSDREHLVREALLTLTTTASDRGLPAAGNRLDALERALDGFGEVCDVWLDAHFRLVTTHEAAENARKTATRSRQDAAARAAEADAAKAEFQQLAGLLEGVERSVGADYQQVLAEIDTSRQSLRQVTSQAAETDRELRDLERRIGVLEERRAVDAARRDTATVDRDAAAARFRSLAAGNLARDAGIEPAGAEGVRATVDLARQVAGAWPNLPHEPRNIADALSRLAETVHACRDALSERADLELEPDDDIQVFAATVDGVRTGADGLLAVVRAEADRARDDITTAERDLFDKTLTGDTRRHLAARIRQSGELVKAMNARLERVRTASRIAVQLLWQVSGDLPPGTKAARELLLKDPVRLNDADRESLHRFFRDRIEQAKAANTASSWQEQLAEVFDYTSWHQFVVRIDRANGTGWQLLTRKLHGALSGGEKAIALHLPLFAAVAAHYQSVPQAPRLILLDEVFVGVDSMNRGQVFELLSSLDLDLMLTSDHE
ncbi:MAG TPA: TIGR02680 family protein, partial [Micromonosporaceae bacterium]|nr:TIGR02680 family protein [Micromonosporaceae bacterium]